MKLAWLALLVGSCVSPAATVSAAQDGGPITPGGIPAGAILVKGAWPSASDSTTPLPEGGALSNDAYDNPYFGLAYPVNRNWIQRYQGPPPSDSGYYVLAQMEPAADSHGSNQGHILIAAQDLFFTAARASSALELMNYYKDHLDSDKVRRTLRTTRVGDHDFARLDYVSAAAGLQWHVFATAIRCHVVEFIFTGADTRAMDGLEKNLSTMQMSAGTGMPMCVKDYATAANLVDRQDPALLEPRFNPIPVRIVIDREGGVKHIHYLSAFPEQARIISEALSHWRFKPYLVNGLPVEIETGMTFGRSSRLSAPALQ